MALEAIEYVPRDENDEPVRHKDLTFATIAGTQGESPQRPIAYVVRATDKDKVLKLNYCIFDRGEKNPAKGLRLYMLGHGDKIPFLKAGYKLNGQTKRSVQDLLDTAHAEGDANVFIIGVVTVREDKNGERKEDETGDAVFAQLWKGAKDPPPAPPEQPTDLRQGPVSKQAKATPRAKTTTPQPPQTEQQDRGIGIEGNSPQAKEVRKLISKAAAADVDVLIVGETGTGKELVAQAIHRLGPRHDQPLVPVNCGAIPEDLFESELFGHVAGAFTGATTAKPGLWALADGGTLFLDEIGNIIPRHQEKILRALDTQEFTRVGATTVEKVDARIVAATNSDLSGMVESGRLRSDLYFRLEVFTITTYPLRERLQDIPIIAQSLWGEITEGHGRGPLPRAIISLLRTYDWPGNVRELRHVLLSLFAEFADVRLGVKRLKKTLRARTEGLKSATSPATEGQTNPYPKYDLKTHLDECLGHLRRTDEILRQTKKDLRPLTGRKAISAETLDSVRAEMELRLEDVDDLCLRRVLFGTGNAFTEVYRLKRSLMDLLELPPDDTAAAREFWHKNLKGQWEEASKAVLSEVKKLVERG